MVTLYWSIGERVRKDILSAERATYGEQIVDALSRKLSEEYGRGFSRANLFHMIRFAEYLIELPPREVLERRLREALRAARERLSTALEDGSEQK